jgi:hypothetical protein
MELALPQSGELASIKKSLGNKGLMKSALKTSYGAAKLAV